MADWFCRECGKRLINLKQYQIDRKDYICVECEYERRKKYTINHKEEIQEYQKEYQKEYRREHKKEMLEYDRLYYQNNKERIRERDKDRYKVRKANDPAYKLKKAISGMVWQALR